MQKNAGAFLVIVVSVTLAVVGCSRAPVDSSERKTEHIASTLTPVSGLVKPLMPDSTRWTVIIGPGEAVHGYRPTANNMAALRQADVVIGVGAGIDSALIRPLQKRPVKGQLMIIFADSVSFDSASHDGHDHSNDELSCDGFDPHLWLEPDLVAAFITSTAAQLAERANENGDIAVATDIESRSLAWLERIRLMDDLYRVQLAPFCGEAILTPHPAFGKLLGRYGIKEYSFSGTSPHASPTPAQLAEAITRANGEDVAAVFTEPQSSGGLARTIADRSGLPFGTLDPLGSGDWEAMMTTNLNELVRTLSAGRGTTGAKVPDATPDGPEQEPSP